MNVHLQRTKQEADEPCGVARLLRQRGNHDEHVAALLHRHVLLLLAREVTDGPSAQVMRPQEASKALKTAG